MSDVEEAHLSERAQEEISGILIKLLGNGCAVGFMESFKRRKNPYEIFAPNAEEEIRRLNKNKNLSPEDLLNLLYQQPIIFDNLYRHGIYL